MRPAMRRSVVGYCYGESTSGQRALYGLGLTGVPIINGASYLCVAQATVNNNCATGSSALYLARQLVAGGIADCVLAVGFEKMERGPLKVGARRVRGRSPSTRTARTRSRRTSA